MASIKFSEKILVDCSPSDAFDYTQDYRSRLEWDTFLVKADLVDASSAALGVKAFCVAQNGLGMETEYVSFKRPNVTAIRMTEGPFMFKTFLGSWRFKDVNGFTEVTFLYSFQLQFPFNLVSQVVKSILQSNVRQRLRDLKASLEKNTR